jgi:single-strand DNA-binding protein
MNQIILIGRTTTDIELKMTQAGKSVCSFTLAVNKNFKKDEANFIPVVAWDKLAETICNYVKKGQQIAIQGELTSRRYEVDGQKRTAYEVVANTFEFCGSSADKPTNSYPPNQNATQGEFEPVDDDSDLPF